MFKTELYPNLSVVNNKNPNRLYATPLFGGVFKTIILIPQGIIAIVLGLVLLVLILLNSFYVLLNGKYWSTAYNFFLDYIRFITKIYFFWVGFFDTYPGFSLSTDGRFVLNMTKPENPNKLFAFPILGGFVRIILLIPYFLYSQILGNGAWVGVIISSFPVLLNGKYPESTYEFAVDAQRVQLGSIFYMAGVSDRYPSFKISMNHQNVKIILIIVGTILFLINNLSNKYGKY